MKSISKRRSNAKRRCSAIGYLLNNNIGFILFIKWRRNMNLIGLDNE